MKPLIILAIETSCDDTGIAIVETQKNEPHFRVLANVISSQVKVHQKWGGIYPTLAKREHQKNLVPVLKQALKEAKLLISFKSRVPNSKQIQNYKFKIQNIKTILNRELVLYQRLEKFLKEYKKPDIDLIAVTIGPGLEPSLWVGVNFAKALAYAWNLPVVPINHIEAHILVNFVDENSKFQMGPSRRLGEWRADRSPNSKPAFAPLSRTTTASQIPNSKNPKLLFPAICLVVSGGHTQLILMKNIGKYKILGETRDDAAGECFDKAAKILGLGYPGGPRIAAKAAEIPNPKHQILNGSTMCFDVAQHPSKHPELVEGLTISSRARGLVRASNGLSLSKDNFKYQNSKSKTAFNVSLPRPMRNSNDYDFSFSGLKTAVLYDWKKRPAKIRKSKAYLQTMAAEIQQAIIDVLVYKTLKAAKNFRARTVILGGGVTANQELRRQIQKKISGELPAVNCFIPKVCYSTDNALMVAAAVFYGKKKPHRKWKNLEAKANLRL